MQSDVRGQRYVTWFLLQRGHKTSEILLQLQEVCQDSAPSKTTVYRWVDDFKSGKMTIEDGPRSGRPPTAVTPEAIQFVASRVKSDPRVTYEELEEELGVGTAAINTILHEHLNLTKQLQMDTENFDS